MIFSRKRSTKHRVSIYITALMAMLAIGGAAANAAQAGEWEIESQSLSGAGLSQESASGSGTLHIEGTLLGQKFATECGTETSGDILTGGRGETVLTLQTCTVSQPNPRCEVVGPIVSHPLSTEQVTVGETAYERLAPSTGEVFLTVKVKNCAVAGSYNLKGRLGAQVNGEGNERVEQPQTFSAAATEAVGGTATFGTSPASVGGSINQHLSGANSGRVWGRGYGEATGHESEEEVLPSEWLINRQTLQGRGLESESIGFSGGPFTFNTVLLGGKIVFSCSALSSEGSEINRNASGGVLWHFTGCTVSVPSSTCHVENIGTNRLESSFLFLGGKTYEKFAPAVGEVVFTLRFTGCSLAGSYNVKGAFSGRAEHYGLERNEHKLVFSPTVSSESGTFMNFSGNTFSVTGEAGQSLTGGNAGQLWSAR